MIAMLCFHTMKKTGQMAVGNPGYGSAIFSSILQFRNSRVQERDYRQKRNELFKKKFGL